MRPPYELRTGARRFQPYDTRTSRLRHTPGSRNSENHVRVNGLNTLADPAHFETEADGPRTSIMPNGLNVGPAGGWVRYLRIVDGRRQGVEAVVTRSMLRTGTSPRYVFPFTTRKTGLMIVRGHLLARVLGGDGADPRNLVPLYHVRNNLPMYQDFERAVQEYVDGGRNVRVSIHPEYAVQPPGVRRGDSVFPIAIRYRALDALTGANVLPREFIRFATGFRGEL